tara:strand:- start:182 stop:700 length:519 start_codon:yes stop_codon:yes gene_type:complete
MSKELIDNSTLSYCIGFFIVFCVIWMIFNQMREYYLTDDPMLQKLKDAFHKFFGQETYWTKELQSLNNRNPMHNINLYKGKQSYTINKEQVHMCLKDEKGDYYPFNMLVYVLAHEIAHVICPNIGHTKEFHAIFDQVLEEMAQFPIDDKGTMLYDPNAEIIMDYCEYAAGEE